MIDDKLKLALSISGAFILGLTGVYAGLADKNAITLATVIALLMGGFSAVGTYIVGYTQVNPRLQPRTSEQLLASVKGSDLSPSAKAAVAPSLAQESAKPGSMGLPLTEQQVAAKQLYQAQKADPEALDVQRLARVRMTGNTFVGPAPEKADPVDALLVATETVRAALVARRAQNEAQRAEIEAQELRLTAGLAPRPPEVVLAAETARHEKEPKP